MALTLALRVWLAHFYAKGPDNFQYLALAREMASGEYFSANYELSEGLAQSRRIVPLYPALIALTIKFGADPEISGCWISIVFATLTVLPLFFVGRKVGNKWTGLFAAVIYAFLPLAYQTSTHILTEDAFCFLSALTVWASVYYVDRPGLLSAALMGVVSALSYLTRDIGFGYVFLAMGLVLVTGFILKREWKKSLVHVAALFLAFAVLSSPFWIFVKARTGEWRPSLREVTSLKADLMGYEKGERVRAPDPEDPDAPVPEQGVEGFSVTRTTTKTLALTWRYLRNALNFNPWQYTVLLVLGIPLVIPLKGGSKKYARELALWTFTVPVMLAYALITPYMVDQRYYLSMLVIACIWAGRAAGLGPILAGRPLKGNLRLLIQGAVLAVALVLVGTYAYQSHQRNRMTQAFYADKSHLTVSGHEELAEDAKRILDIEPGSRILARKPFFAYYLDGLHVTVAETVPGVRQQVADGLADYVIIGSMSVRKYRRGLRPLITDVDPLPGAGLVYRRYFRDFNKLFSIYKNGAPPFSIETGIARRDPAAALEKAIQYLDAGYVEHARQMLIALDDVIPENPRLHWELMQLYLIYGNYDGVSLDLAEDELVEYAMLSGDDSDLAQYKRIIQQLKIRHSATWGRRR